MLHLILRSLMPKKTNRPNQKPQGKAHKAARELGLGKLNSLNILNIFCDKQPNVANGLRPGPAKPTSFTPLRANVGFFNFHNL